MARSTIVVPEVLQADGLRMFQDQMDVFTEKSLGTIDLSYDREFLAQNGGDFIEHVVFAHPSGGIQHADEASPTGGVTAVDITQAKGADVTQSMFAYYQWNRDMERKGAAKPAEYTAALAGILAHDKLIKIRNNLIAAGVAAIDSMDTTDGSSASANLHILDVAIGHLAGGIVSLTQGYLNQMLAKMKDAREDIIVFLMPSNVYFDLVGDSMTNYKIDKVAGMLIVEGVPAAQGRAIIVADIPALINEQTSSYYTKYNVLGLGVGALTARVIGEDDVDTDVITDENTKRYTFRQDFDTSYHVQSMLWDKTPLNPTDAELATAGNWDEFYSDHKAAKLIKGIFNSGVDAS